ncbi:MAG: hypothetical protein ABSC94_31565 [Polyangiaceae bacterium]|jgi:hypothetical protein
MKLCLSVAVALVLGVIFAAPSADATPGAICFSDANCGYGEVCIKEHSWSPSGVCIKGSH